MNENNTTTHLDDLLSAANVVAEVTVPVEQTKKKGVPVGTRRSFPINLEAFGQLFEEVEENAGQPKVEGGSDWEARLKTLNLLKTIPQPVVTEIPRTKEEINKLIQAEMADAEAEDRIPDLVMIGSLATRKVKGNHTLLTAGEEGMKDITFVSADIMAHFTNQAKMIIAALHKISDLVAQKAEELSEETPE